MNIKDIVKGNEVRFLRYRQQVCYYWIETKEGPYMFPVPLSDVQDATLNHTEKAITYMRYIRKAIEEETFISMTEYK